MSTIDDSVEENDACVSIQCKVCNDSFTPSTILKHISSPSNSCEKAYCSEEINQFKKRTIKRKRENEKKSYDPAKRRNNHLRRRLSTKCKFCHMDVDKTTVLNHLNDSKNCKNHYTEEELSVIEGFTNEPKSIEIKKYDYDPEKRSQKHLQYKKERAEELEKYKEQQSKKRMSELRLYLLEKFERHARDKNLHEMNKTKKDLQSALDIIGNKLTEEMQDTIKVIRNKYKVLYQKFEVEINETAAKANESQSEEVNTLVSFYLNLYLTKPHRTSLNGRFIPNLAYSNRLYHTWQDERTKNLKTFKKIAQDLNIFYDWSPFDSSGSFTKCDYCKICHPGIYTRRCYCNLTSCILCKLHEAQ